MYGFGKEDETQRKQRSKQKPKLANQSKFLNTNKECSQPIKHV